MSALSAGNSSASRGQLLESKFGWGKTTSTVKSKRGSPIHRREEELASPGPRKVETQRAGSDSPVAVAGSRNSPHETEKIRARPNRVSRWPERPQGRQRAFPNCPGPGDPSLRSTCHRPAIASGDPMDRPGGRVAGSNRACRSHAIGGGEVSRDSLFPQHNPPGDEGKGPI